MSKTILVTGASGFIGTALCERLRGRGHIRALIRRDIDGPWDESVLADLAQDGSLEEAVEGVDTIFHLAAKAHDMTAGEKDAAEFVRVNGRGTLRLIEAAAAARVRAFVYLSSVKAMGEGGDRRLDEEGAARPESAYGRSKREAEEIVLGTSGVAHRCVLRPSLIYGAGAKGNIARMITAIDHGVFPPIPKVTNRRSMVHIDDVVQALLLAAEKPQANGRVFIVTDGRTYTTRQMYEWICEAMGRKVPRWSVPVPVLRAMAILGDGIGRATGKPFVFDSSAFDKLLGSAHYDSASIQETLGYTPRHSLQEAVPEIVRRHLDSSRADAYSATASE